MSGRQVENLLLLPGPLTAERDRWQALANALPRDAVLIVVPMEAGPQRDALERIARSFAAKGRQVTLHIAPARPDRSGLEDAIVAHPVFAPTQLAFELTAS